jgi:two-component system CheB/CheR fusion protein
MRPYHSIAHRGPFVTGKGKGKGNSEGEPAKSGLASDHVKARKKSTARASQTEVSEPQTSSSSKSRPTSDQFIPGANPIIVAMGASAGGLEAIEKFCANVPKGTDLAFIVIQHQDPKRKSMLVELLQRGTHLQVEAITDQTRVKPGHVYVAPAAARLSITGSTLQLERLQSSSRWHAPIDEFFRKLARERGSGAIGVILSGMGSDGTQGLRAIKEHGGAVFVQSPESASFSGMPASAVNAGLADVIATAEALPEEICRFLEHIPERSGAQSDAPSEQLLDVADRIALILRRRTGHDFSQYKKSSFIRRAERRMALLQQPDLAAYSRYLEDHQHEADLFFRDLLINVTQFFRDASIWNSVIRDMLPALLATHPDGGELRAWVPACSTGEEAYSLAMAFHEALDILRPTAHFSLQIFATDLDSEAIDVARRADYPETILADIGEQRLQRFFIEQDGVYHVNNVIREMVVFAQHNLIMDAPFTRLDLISCRNLLIYFDQDLQRKLIQMFHYALKPGGFLILGASESIGNATALFEQLPGKQRIFEKKEGANLSYVTDFPVVLDHDGKRSATNTHSTTRPDRKLNLKALVENLLLNTYAPAAALVSESGELLYVSGKTGDYLEPASGEASLSIVHMAREGLGRSLRKVIARALSEQAALVEESALVEIKGDQRPVTVSARPLAKTATRERMLLITFINSAREPQRKVAVRSSSTDPVVLSEVSELKQQLEAARQQLQTVLQDNEDAQEELKYSNERLQSLNEELQSTNEELMTSKEEMQSMNEELQSVNYELRAKVNELSRANDDMENLFDSTEIATLFLDRDLKVRRYTARTLELFKLIPSDVGRPIADLVSDMDYPSFESDLKSVLQSLVNMRHEVSSGDGRWFLVQIMPYRTHQDRVDGLVITFTNITRAKELEASQHEALSMLQQRFDEQAGELSEASELEATLRKAKAALQARLKPAHGDSSRTREKS